MSSESQIKRYVHAVLPALDAIQPFNLQRTQSIFALTPWGTLGGCGIAGHAQQQFDLWSIFVQQVGSIIAPYAHFLEKWLEIVDPSAETIKSWRSSSIRKKECISPDKCIRHIKTFLIEAEQLWKPASAEKAYPLLRKELDYLMLYGIVHKLDFPGMEARIQLVFSKIKKAKSKNFLDSDFDSHKTNIDQHTNATVTDQYGNVTTIDVDGRIKLTDRYGDESSFDRGGFITTRTRNSNWNVTRINEWHYYYTGFESNREFSKRKRPARSASPSQRRSDDRIRSPGCSGVWLGHLEARHRHLEREFNGAGHTKGQRSGSPMSAMASHLSISSAAPGLVLPVKTLQPAPIVRLPSASHQLVQNSHDSNDRLFAAIHPERRNYVTQSYGESQAKVSRSGEKKAWLGPGGLCLAEPQVSQKTVTTSVKSNGLSNLNPESKNSLSSTAVETPTSGIVQGPTTGTLSQVDMPEQMKQENPQINSSTKAIPTVAVKTEPSAATELRMEMIPFVAAKTRLETLEEGEGCSAKTKSENEDA